MIQPKLTEESFVSKRQFVTTPCQCVTCQHKMQVVLETEVIVLLGKLLDFKRPPQGAFRCSNCNSSYVRWGDFVIENKIR